MTQRYYVAEPIAGSQATLAGDEARHLARVMRVRPGQQVTLFDGSGAEFLAQVDEVGRREVRLSVLKRCAIDRELAFPLTVAAALPKGDRQRWLVEKLVELGATQLVPLVTKRGVAQPGQQALERLRRAVIEAAKQCGRNRLMDVATPRALGELVAEHAGGLIAHPGGTPFGELREDWMSGQPALAVGPEGGFDDDEIAQAQDAGWRCVDLGPRILRVETAALWLATAVSVPRR